MPVALARVCPAAAAHGGRERHDHGRGCAAAVSAKRHGQESRCRSQRPRQCRSKRVVQRSLLLSTGRGGRCTQWVLGKRCRAGGRRERGSHERGGGECAAWLKE